MNFITKILNKIPGWLSGKVSIFIYIFLFFYLVIFALITALFPALKDLAPTDHAQIILGNYTNVLSALGASIAAGGGVAIHGKIKVLHESHKKLEGMISDLHEKIDELAKNKLQILISPIPNKYQSTNATF